MFRRCWVFTRLPGLSLYWLVGLVVLMLTEPVMSQDKPLTESIQVRVIGRLETGVLAIGGETTGTTITAKGVTWELDLGGEDGVLKLAEELSGRQVEVEGELERRAGVEIAQRWIVRVSRLGEPRPRERPAPEEVDEPIRWSREGDVGILQVHSAKGIGRTTLSREEDGWPERVLVRLHLRGLESFRVEFGERSLEWSVSVGEGVESRVTFRQGKNEAVVRPQSRWYTPVSIEETEPKLPLEGGYFEVELPAAVLESSPETIELHWIDFYRR